MRRFLLVCLTVAACSGGHKPAAKTPPPPVDPIPTSGGPDCKAVADHLVTVVLADKPDQQAAASPGFRSRCADDKWSDTARSCFADKWLSLAYGRVVGDGDACSKSQLESAFRAANGNIKALLVAATQTDDFLYLPASSSTP